jgi:hypothetical protein
MTGVAAILTHVPDILPAVSHLNAGNSATTQRNHRLVTDDRQFS